MTQNNDMIMRDAVVEGFRNFDHLVFFNMHLNISTRASSIFASIENARGPCTWISNSNSNFIYQTKTGRSPRLKAVRTA